MEAKKKLKFPISYVHSNLYEADYERFKSNSWLSSECINFYFQILGEKYNKATVGCSITLMDPACYSFILLFNDFQSL